MHERIIAPGRPINVVSLVRAPIARNVSHFFFHLKRDFDLSAYGRPTPVPVLTRLFLDHFDHDYPLRWFDNHIKHCFGINVFATPFPDAGVETYRHENVRLLVFRSELSDPLKAQALTSLLGLRHVRLRRENTGAHRDYADRYSRFKQEAILPTPYLERMTTSTYFRHFYSEEDAARIRAHWRER